MRFKAAAMSRHFLAEQRARAGNLAPMVAHGLFPLTFKIQIIRFFKFQTFFSFFISLENKKYLKNVNVLNHQLFRMTTERNNKIYFFSTVL